MSETQKHTKPNVPNLRFPGFEGEWESWRLSDIAEYRKERTATSRLTVETYVSTENMLPDYQGVIPATNIPAGGNVSAFYPGDVLLSNIRPYLKKVWQANFIGGCSTDVMVIKSKKYVFDKFLYYIIANDSFINYAMSGAKGVKMPRGDKEQLMKYELATPSIDEQKRIAALLSLIDQRIAIQNKLIEDCTALEKEIQNQVFNQIDAPLVPLSSISQRITERNTTLESNNVLTISAREGLVSQLDFFNKSVASENLSNYLLLHKGDFAYNKSYSSDYPWGAIKHLERYDTGVLSPLYFCFRPDKERVDTRYLQFFFDTKLWHKHIAEIAVEGARNHGLLNMAVGDFYTMPILLPTMKEQQAIADKLSAFRQKRTTEESIYRFLLLLKQYLLNNLFV